MTADPGAPGAPRFDVVLRGYDRRQVDDHVARLQRVLARMRADLEVARSQQPPPPAAPAGNRSRLAHRPRPGQAAPPPSPDAIGSFTDRMQRILQAAEDEAAEIRRQAHLAARAEQENTHAQLAHVVRQRDAVQAELNRLRGELDGLRRVGWPAFPPRDDGARAPHPGPPGHQPGSPPGPPPGQQPQPGPPLGPQPQPGSPPGQQQQQPGSPPGPGRPTPDRGAPAPPEGGSRPPGHGGAPAGGPGAPAAPGGDGSSRDAGPREGAAAPGREAPPAPPANGRSTTGNGTAAPTVVAPAVGSPAASAPTGAAPGESRPAIPDEPASPDKPAAHRLPTGAYPAAGDAGAGRRPTDAAGPEPGDLFRPTARGGTAAAPAAGERPARTDEGRDEPAGDRSAAAPPAEGGRADREDTTVVVGGPRRSGGGDEPRPAGARVDGGAAEGDRGGSG